jgi:hypothetical protein
MRLTEEQREIHFKDENDRPVHVRIILPSPPHGGWPGNNVTVRVWQMCRKGSAHYSEMTDAEVKRAEAAFGEVDPAKIDFLQHPTLGRVAFVR